MTLIFSTSSVGRFLVFNCLEQFLSLVPFESMWSFLSSSSQVLVLLVSICSFLVLVCRECMWILWTRSYVFHQRLAFSSWIFFSVVLSKSMCISALGLSSSPSSSLVILFIHSALSLCFWLPYFRPKSFGFFVIRLLVCFCVIPSQLLIEFSFVVLECSVLSVLFYPFSISL